MPDSIEVLADFDNHLALFVDAMDACDGWATSVRASSPLFTLLGSLDGVEADLRQLRRTRPLEVEEFEFDGHVVRVPTLPEALRVRAYLVVQRNQVRDYLDTVALADRLGIDVAVTTLATIDDFYADRSGVGDSVLTAVVQRLSEPSPRDERVTRQLASYKGLVPRGRDWQAVVAACHELADEILQRTEELP